MTAAHTHFSDEVCCIAFWNNVVIIDIDGDMTAARMRVLGKAYRVLAETHPHVVGLSLLRAGTPVADSESRAESTKFMKDLADVVVHVSMVIEAKGIVAQMLSSVIRGINAVTRQNTLSVETDVQAGIRKVVPHVVTKMPRAQIATDLTAALNDVRTKWRPVPATAP